MLGERDLVFIGAMLLLAGRETLLPDDKKVDNAIDTSKKVFDKVFYVTQEEV